MNSLKTLSALVGGALIIAIMYGIAFGDKDNKISFDFEDGEGVRHIVNGDRGDFMLKQGDLTIEASWRGDYALSDAGDDIDQLDRKLEITRKEENEVAERAVFEGGEDGVERTYYRDGEKQSAGTQSDVAARALLLRFLRASGVKADERVAILMREGGADAVLSEMILLQGDHARQRYITTLTKNADLTPEQLHTLVKIISAMEGDHDIRMALEAILENERAGPPDLPLLFEAARNVEGDYDLRRVIENFAEINLDEDSITLALGLFENIDSDHDLRRAGEALLALDAITDANVAQLLSAAADRIDSDHDLRLLLSEAAPRLAGGREVSDAWLLAFSALDSDHDKRIALEEASEVQATTYTTVKALIDATHDIGSDHDRRLALTAFADRARKNPETMAAFRSAARAIGSDYDREQALDAIGESGSD